MLVRSERVASRPAPYATADRPAPAPPARPASGPARTLVLAASWPAHRPPTALVAALRAAGVEVELAVPRARRRGPRRRRTAPPEVVYAPPGTPLVPAARSVLVLDAPPPRAPDAPLLAGAIEVQAASPALADRAVAGGADAARVRVVRPGVDVELLRPPAAPREAADGVLRLACVAPLHWTAGLEYLLVALRRLLDSGLDASLDLYGEGPARAATLFAVSDLGLGERVALRPHEGTAALARALGAADVCALAAVEDRPWPGALEAMACGLPVVASDGPSVRDAVRPGREGLLVPARDPAALAEAVVELASDPSRRGAMGAAARERVQEAFSLERAAREVAPLP